MKNLPERSRNHSVLVLYDGHKSHINLGLIDWAKNEYIILFILPAHTSHVLQPLDVGCFGPFEKIYNNVSHKFMRENIGQRITRYNVCSLGCTAYSKALTASNLQSLFRKTGIHPYNPYVLHSFNFKPSEVLQEDKSTDLKEKLNFTESSSFFSEKSKKITEKKAVTKKRQYLSNVASGKAITEDSTIDRIRQHEESKKRPKSEKRMLEPQTGTSGTYKPASTELHQVSPLQSEEESLDDESEFCCVCNLFTPAELRHCTSLTFVEWVQCIKCGHWVNLVFCTSVRVVRRGYDFLCKHCVSEE